MTIPTNVIRSRKSKNIQYNWKKKKRKLQNVQHELTSLKLGVNECAPERLSVLAPESNLFLLQKGNQFLFQKGNQFFLQKGNQFSSSSRKVISYCPRKVTNSCSEKVTCSCSIMTSLCFFVKLGYKSWIRKALDCDYG